MQCRPTVGRSSYLLSGPASVRLEAQPQGLYSVRGGQTARTPPQFRGVEACAHLPLPEYDHHRLGHVEQPTSAQAMGVDRIHNPL